MREQNSGRIRQLYIPAVLCVALWGSAPPCVKMGYQLFAISSEQVFSQLLFAGLRFALAGLMVWVIYFLRRRGPAFPDASSIGPVLEISLFQSVLQYLCYYTGVSRTSGFHTAVLSGTQTFFAILFAHFFMRGDRLNWRKGLACVVGFTGVLLLQNGGGEISFGLGDGLVLLSAMSAGMGAIVSRKVSQGRDPMFLTAWQLLLGGLLLLAVGLCGGGTLGAVSVKGLLLLGYLALLSAVAFTVWTGLLARFSVGQVSIFGFGIPLFGALFSALLLGEKILSLRSLAALALVCAGIALANWIAPKQEKMR